MPSSPCTRFEEVLSKKGLKINIIIKSHYRQAIVKAVRNGRDPESTVQSCVVEISVYNKK